VEKPFIIFPTMHILSILEAIYKKAKDYEIKRLGVLISKSGSSPPRVGGIGEVLVQLFAWKDTFN